MNLFYTNCKAVDDIVATKARYTRIDLEINVRTNSKFLAFQIVESMPK